MVTDYLTRLLAPVEVHAQFRFIMFVFLISYVGGMASKGLRSDVPINRDKRLMRVMSSKYL